MDDGREMILCGGGMKWTEGTKDNQVDMNFDLISSVLSIDQDSELRLLSGPVRRSVLSNPTFAQIWIFSETEIF